MIIPIRCFTCGKVIGNKYKTYLDKTKKKNDELTTIEINSKNVKKTEEGKVMDELGLERYCCRKIFVSHLDLIDELLPYD